MLLEDYITSMAAYQNDSCASTTAVEKASKDTRSLEDFEERPEP